MNQICDDNELVERIQKDCVEAFDLIYKKYSGQLYAFGLKYLKSSDEAKELVQSVFLKVWEKRHKLNKELSFKSFLFTVTYNDICKLFRKRNYQRQFIIASVNENSQVSTEAEESIDYRSSLERVLQIINKLPERQKSVFLRSRIEGKTTKEIAVEMSLSPGTVDNYISECLKYLRRSMRYENLTILLIVLFFCL
jgi:RNA polymerase sigma-70 factor (family 1)